MNRRNFFSGMAAIPVVLQAPFASAAAYFPHEVYCNKASGCISSKYFLKRPTQIVHQYRPNHSIVFSGDGSKVIATVTADDCDYQLGSMMLSGDGDLSLDRWFYHGPYKTGPSTINSSWIDYPDHRRLDTLKFVMEKSIDRIIDRQEITI